jgi:hypothetical protein
VPCGEIVEHDDAMSGAQKNTDHMGADVAGAPRYEHIHWLGFSTLQELYLFWLKRDWRLQSQWKMRTDPALGVAR